jgi:ribose transport system permease protein
MAEKLMPEAATPGPPPSESSARHREAAGRIARQAQNYGIVVVFAALFIFLSIASDQFLSVSNLKNLVDQATTIGFIAAAGTLVMVAGGFDLSVGAIYALVGVVLAEMVPSVGVPAAMLIAILAGCGLGLLNGVITTRINPLVATLSTGIIFSGVSILISGGYLLNVANPSFTTLGNAHWLGVYVSTWAFLGFALVLGFVLQRTLLGRYIYAVGGNQEAARLSGVSMNRVRAATYVLSGSAAAIAAVFYVSRIGTAEPTAGSSFPLAAIAAIVVGGTSIAGGEGRVGLTVVGVLLLAMITNGFILLGVDPLYQQIVQGVIILAAVFIDEQAKRSRR